MVGRSIEEVLVLRQERKRQVRDIRISRVQVPLAERKEPLLDRQHLVDQFRAGEGRAPGLGIATEAMPQPKQAAVERQRLTAEPFRRGSPGL